MNKYPKSTYNKDNKSNIKKYKINWNITNKQCRVIEDNKRPVIMQTSAAIEYAQSLGLDLVEIGYDKSNNCSNCKVCDYGKFIYEQKRHEKMIKKQAKAMKSELKCLQMSLTTDIADLNRLVEHAKEFLKNGDRVKISLRFRNRRESENINLAKDILRDTVMKFDNLAVLDSQISLNGRELSCILKKNPDLKN